MRVRACGALVLGVWLASSGVGRADDQAEALKIVGAAMKAAGGAAKLAKLDTLVLKGKGAVHNNAKEAPFSGEGTLRGPDRFRLDLDVSLGDEPVKIVFALDGDKGWRKINDRVIDTPRAVIPLIKAGLDAFRMAQMLAPLEDKGVKLSPLGEIKIEGRAAEGIKIVRKGRPDMDLYFDKQTHLPVTCALHLKEPEDDQELKYEWSFSGHKEMAGVQHPSKLVLSRDGKKLLELEISEVKPEEKVDDGVFAKP
jgi:hypothetical protein